MKKFLGLLFFVILVASGCSAPKVKIQKLEPAKSVEAATLRKVAVLPFDGPNGSNFASEFEARLVSIKVDDKQFFEVVSRTALNEIMDELRMGQSGLVDPSTAASIGKIIGAKGIFIGQVTKANVTDSRFVEDRSECTSTNEKGDCTRLKKWKVPCTKRVADFSVTPKLVDVATGRIVYSDNYADSMESSRCSDSSQALVDKKEMISRLADKKLASISKDIAPFYVHVEIELMKDEQGITSDVAKEKLGAGIKFALNNRFDRACELWSEAKPLSPTSVSLLHNLAVCAEANGNLTDALSLVKEADRQLSTPNKTITNALTRIAAGVEKQQKLKAQITSP